MGNLMTPGCCRQQFWRTNELRRCSWYSYTKIPTRIHSVPCSPPFISSLLKKGLCHPIQSIRFLQLPYLLKLEDYSHFRIPRFVWEWYGSCLGSHLLGASLEKLLRIPTRKPKPLTKLLVWRKNPTLPIIPKPQSMIKSNHEANVIAISYLLQKLLGALFPG